MEEIWRDIEELDNKYQISNLGRIKSKERYAKTCGEGKRLVKEKILKPVKCRNGYLEMQGTNINGERKVFLLHRLVAKYFIPNPFNLPEVNHKDEVLSNCEMKNLEWCTSKYNANYGHRNEKCRKALAYKQKRVIQKTLDGEIIRIRDSLSDIEREINFDESSIIRVCKGRQHTSYGFKLEYADKQHQAV